MFKETFPGADTTVTDIGGEGSVKEQAVLKSTRSFAVFQQDQKVWHKKTKKINGATH